jgi:hypothetical protein
MNGFSVLVGFGGFDIHGSATDGAFGKSQFAEQLQELHDSSTKKFYNGIASGEILLWWVGGAIAGLFIRRHRPGDSADEQCKANGPCVRRLLG